MTAAGTYLVTAKVYYNDTWNVSAPQSVNVTVSTLVAPSNISVVPNYGNNTLNITYHDGAASHFYLIGTNDLKWPVNTWPVFMSTNGTVPATFNIPIGSSGPEMFYKVKGQ